MTMTAYEVMEYIKYYARAGNGKVYIRPDDLNLLSTNQTLQLFEEIGNCKVVPDAANEKVEEAVERLGIRKKEFIGSLPTDKIGKWIKTN